jgi:hypothetical protein
MAVNSTQSSNTTLKFASGEIKLSEIKNFFGGNNNGVSFSKYYRKTSTSIATNDFHKESTGHFVPDATENTTVATSGTISFSDFRGDGDNGVLKKYIIEQSGTNSNLDLDTSSFWNSNLNKNVPKVANLNGRMKSGSAPSTSDGSGYNHESGAAVSFNAEAYNLDIDVNSGVNNQSDPGNTSNARGIFGQGGEGGNVNSPDGSAGGTALYVEQNSNLSNNSAVIRVNASNGRIYAGGGGGVAGRAGSAGSTAYCRFFTISGGNTVTNSGFTIRGENSCYNSANSHCKASVTVGGVSGSPSGMAGGGWRGSSCNGSGGRSRCRGGGRFRGDAGNMGCYNTITKICRYKHTFSGNTGNGGTGGDGGRGKGSNNLNTNVGVNSANNGNCPNCNSISGQSVEHYAGNTCGNDGTNGTAGADYGASAAGSNNRSAYAGGAGHAVYSNSKSQVFLTNSSNNKGLISNVST